MSRPPPVTLKTHRAASRFKAFVVMSYAWGFLILGAFLIWAPPGWRHASLPLAGMVLLSPLTVTYLFVWSVAAEFFFLSRCLREGSAALWAGLLPVVWGLGFMLPARFIARRLHEPFRRDWVRAREGRCIPCGYDLRGSEGDICPECGAKRRDPPPGLRFEGAPKPPWWIRYCFR